MNKEELLLLCNNEQAVLLEKLMNFVLEENQKFNLTAIKKEEDFRELMIYDSLLPLKHLNFEHKTVLDVGTGAGFPGLPLAICSSSTFTLLDSTSKKINFINEFISKNDISNATAISARAEEYALYHRENYDYVISRAVANLNMLAELCLPMVNVGGLFIAMKSNKANEELKESKNAIKKLGGEVIEIFEDILPNSKENRTLIIIKKVVPTNHKYPRRFDQIKSKPL